MIGGFGTFWGLHQYAVASQAATDAARGASTASSAKRMVEALELRIDKLTLINMAMWSLLQESGNFTEEDLLERVTQIDLADGTADGKITKQIKRCPKCDRVMSPRHAKCLYCGAARLDFETFDSAM